MHFLSVGGERQRMGAHAFIMYAPGKIAEEGTTASAITYTMVWGCIDEIAVR